jgi:hypothetical protein
MLGSLERDGGHTVHSGNNRRHSTVPTDMVSGMAGNGGNLQTNFVRVYLWCFLRLYKLHYVHSRNSAWMCTSCLQGCSVHFRQRVGAHVAIPAFGGQLICRFFDARHAQLSTTSLRLSSVPRV